MIDIERREIRNQGKIVRLVRWEVWFWTMEGLWNDLDSALASAIRIEFPVEMIRTIPVAIGEDGSYEPRYT